jgi:hypothetical protein
MDIETIISNCDIIYKTKKYEEIDNLIFEELELPYILYYIYKKFNNKYMFFDYKIINFFQLYYIYDTYIKELSDIINIGFIYCKKYNIDISYIKKTKKIILIYNPRVEINIKIRNSNYINNIDFNKIEGIDLEYLFEIIDIIYNNLKNISDYSFDFINELYNLDYIHKINIKKYYIYHPDYYIDFTDFIDFNDLINNNLVII